MIVINSCRLPDRSEKGDRTCLPQCNRAIGKECAARKHRKDLLEETKKHVQGMNEEKEILIAGDCNQCIGGNKFATILP